MGIKLISLPLLVLGVLSVLSMAGFGSVMAGSAGYVNIGAAGAASGYGYIDSTGVLVAYPNRTLVDQVNGRSLLLGGANGQDWYYWNTTNMYPVTENFASTADNAFFNFSGSSFTVMGVLIVVVGIAVLAGFKIFGSGNSELGVEAIVKGSFFAFIFVMLSLGGTPLLNSVPVIGPIVTLALSVLYVVGVVDMFGHPSGA